jgi:hypothetical protein
MKLSEAQQVFTRNIALLILYTYEQDYALTFGEAWRPPEMVAIYAQDGRGSGNSLHPARLAIDFNLFKDGIWQTGESGHDALGAYWETLHSMNIWGGHFKRRDFNHYEMQRP